MLRDTAGEWLLPNMLRLPRFSTPPSLRDTSPIFCIAKHPAMLRGTAREVGNSSGLLHSRYFNRQKRNKKERVHRNDVPSLYRAEDEAQTRDPQLGRLMLYQLSYFRNFFLWAKMDSNHRRRKPADLQSAPFGHSGICP